MTGPPGRERGSGPRVTPAENRLHITTSSPPSAEVTLESVIDGTRSGRACEAPGCTRALPPGRRRFCSDLCRVRGQRAERVTETEDFGRAAIRMIRAAARRVGASDIAEFGLMWEIMREAEHAVAAAIGELRAKGFTWAEIAAEIGVSRQTMHQWHQRRAGRSAVNTCLTANGALDGSGDTPAQREARRRRRADGTPGGAR